MTTIKVKRELTVQFEISDDDPIPAAAWQWNNVDDLEDWEIIVELKDMSIAKFFSATDHGIIKDRITINRA